MKQILLTVNENASGPWANRVGTKLEFVSPGHNRLHVIVRRPGERRTFGFPTRWLDGLTQPDDASASSMPGMSSGQLVMEVGP